MMSQIKALVITGYGTNCEYETAHACSLAGAKTDIVHISDILDGKSSIADYHMLTLAGGFLDGDDLGSAQVESIRLKYAKINGHETTIYQELLEFNEKGGLILGICNGFQALVKTGLLPFKGSRRVSLTFNDSSKFEDRWVNLSINPDSPCIFTRGIDSLYVPVRHGEGKFVCDNDATLAEITEADLDAVHYADANGLPTMNYPDNPNGSINAIAGITDSTGRIFGLMPHPEAFTHFTNHPKWTRTDGMSLRGEGMAIFDNAVNYLRENI